MEWHKVPVKIDESRNYVKALHVAGKKLCLISENGVISVTSSRCPHAGADLTKGWCEGGKLICPFHRHRFNIETGAGDEQQHNYIRVYPLKKENGDYYIGIDKSLWNKIFG
ncbi:Rieske (2Fe-2S) protein [Sphingobacterium lactis]|uniref:Nitrite reductase (NADH) small subunit/3-phenylpropionate/trans-cinnamate dioxygenase ferredoxin subunit n=1 Tax=Sphingobacterium lactis TaxID=797291 RepID=A0A1H5ZHC7_9SPHI|nr:Rieske 2Fe-2S domain-containing protein [Sphingobacterium lactis]SEG35933.1 nitrite reductase (NADH) small subunit/3-phenylpropionate/trans-cinnamate dioxygenase ferredoxin subunit [Sphingobacterium lactis]